MARRLVSLGLLLVLAVALSGCNLKDWYNQEGTVRVELRALTKDESDIETFRALELAIHSVQVRQMDSAQPESSTKSPAEIIDLVALANGGGRLLLLEEKVNLRGFQQLVLRAEALQGTDAAGQTVPGCEQGVRWETPPCIRFAARGSYPLTLDPSTFFVERGETMSIVIPVGVAYDAVTGEYYIFTKPAEKA